jgi:hypothetical protein
MHSTRRETTRLVVRGLKDKRSAPSAAQLRALDSTNAGVRLAVVCVAPLGFFYPACPPGEGSVGGACCPPKIVGRQIGSGQRSLLFLTISEWNGGAGRDRTDDLSSAIAALSQLSYGPRQPAFRERPPCLSSEGAGGPRHSGASRNSATEKTRGAPDFLPGMANQRACQDLPLAGRLRYMVAGPRAEGPFHGAFDRIHRSRH